MSAWDHRQATISCIPWVADDRIGRPQPCEAAPEVGVWVVLSGVGRGIHKLPTPDAAQLARTDQATTTDIAYPYEKSIPGDLTAYDNVHQLPG